MYIIQIYIYISITAIQGYFGPVEKKMDITGMLYLGFRVTYWFVVGNKRLYYIGIIFANSLLRTSLGFKVQGPCRRSSPTHFELCADI